MPRLVARRRKLRDPNEFKPFTLEALEQAKETYLRKRARGEKLTPPEAWDELIRLFASELVDEDRVRLAGPIGNVVWFLDLADFLLVAGELSLSFKLLTFDGAGRVLGYCRRYVHDCVWKWGRLLALYTEEEGQGEAVFSLVVLDKED